MPQIFVATGASKWGTDTAHPWTIGWQPNYISEARVYAQYLKQEKPEAKVAVLYQNDDFGKDLLGGFKKAIEGSEITVVAEQSYEVTDPSVDPQMRNLAGSKADVFLNVTTPKFGSPGAGRRRQEHEAGTRCTSSTTSPPRHRAQAGRLRERPGRRVVLLLQGPRTTRTWADDPEMKLYKAKMQQYAPDADRQHPVPHLRLGGGQQLPQGDGRRPSARPAKGCATRCAT